MAQDKMELSCLKIETKPKVNASIAESPLVRAARGVVTVSVESAIIVNRSGIRLVLGLFVREITTVFSMQRKNSDREVFHANHRRRTGRPRSDG